MTNGAMNVEIGNPAYKIYEGDPDDDAGELLDSDFALDPDKVTELKANRGQEKSRTTLHELEICKLNQSLKNTNCRKCSEIMFFSAMSQKKK